MAFAWNVVGILIVLGLWWTGRMAWLAERDQADRVALTDARRAALEHAVHQEQARMALRQHVDF